MSFIGFKFSKFEKLYFISILSLSFLIFSFFVNSNVFFNFWDEQEYIDHGIFVLSEGTLHGPFRTYLYPSIIAFFYFIFNGDLVNIKIFISIFQYSVYLITIIFIANRINVKNNNKLIWYSIITVGFLNPYLIQASTLLLTDILASCFIVLSIIGLSSSNLNKTKIIAFTAALFYCAIMIRPSSLIFLPIIIMIILFRFVKHKNFNILKISAIFIILTVIFVPQLIKNVTQYNDWTPLLHESLYEDQTIWAVKILKYGTVVIEGEKAQLVYHNPFYTSSENTDMFHLLYTDFFTFIPTYFFHMFGVLDWGYVDAYISDYYPSNRIPASLFLYSIWFFILFGILQQAWKKEMTKNILFLVLIISGILYILFIATTVSESRFGYPIFLLLLPFFGLGINGLYQMKRRFNRIKLAIVYLLFMIGFFYGSFWLDYQSARIDWFAILNL